jgi:hypothetical protein
MGRKCVENGLAIGRTLYAGHGTRATPSEQIVFEDREEMQSKGFELYCKDDLNHPPMENNSELSILTRVVGVVFASKLASTAASNFMRNVANYREFTHGLGVGSKDEIISRNVERQMERLLFFYNLPAESNSPQVWNFDKPGTNDTLGIYLEEINRQLHQGSVGFYRTGVFGFKLLADPLANETLLNVRQACEKFHW